MSVVQDSNSEVWELWESIRTSTLQVGACTCLYDALHELVPDLVDDKPCAHSKSGTLTVSHVFRLPNNEPVCYVQLQIVSDTRLPSYLSFQLPRSYVAKLKTYPTLAEYFADSERAASSEKTTIPSVCSFDTDEPVPF